MDLSSHMFCNDDIHQITHYTEKVFLIIKLSWAIKKASLFEGQSNPYVHFTTIEINLKVEMLLIFKLGHWNLWFPDNGTPLYFEMHQLLWIICSDE